MEQTFRYPSEIHEINRIRQDLGSLETEWNISKSKMKQILVIVEEIFSNIVRFAFEDTHKHEIEISLRKNENILGIEIIDDGIAFNPLEYSEDPLRDPALVESGGMGLTLVQSFSNRMSYERKANRNHLHIEKKI